MKKTISINISGVIFHIEEDGYDKLKGYLASIQQYFSTYEDSQEIITDIENRIAEKLHNKLKGEEKLGTPRQAVTLDDVNELIRSMGTVADFVAVEEEEILVGASQRPESKTTSSEAPPQSQPGYGSQQVPPRSTTAGRGPRRLYRDLRRKVIAGVASGIANYFNIDPVWVRLAFLTLVLALPPFAGASNSGEEFFAGLSGFTTILYIAMWIAFPGSTTLEEDKSVKKFYRNPDDKVLGGVSSGIAAYFGIDSGLVRLLFVLAIFAFGTGFLAYIILWIISPEAKTMTEKMEMKGQPITLENIEHNVKRSLNIDENEGNENALTKVLLFPFRVISAVFSGLGRALGPLAWGIGTVVRVLVGVMLLFVGGAIMIGALTILGTGLGMQGLGIETGNFPLELIQQELSVPMILAAFVAIFIPGLALAILGITLISQRTLVSSRVNLTLLSIWFLSLIGIAATIPPIVSDFRRTGVVEEAVVATPTGTPTFTINDLDDTSFRPSIELEAYNGTTWQVVKRLQAQGSSRRDAQANAKAAIYNFAVQDSTIRFDNEYEIKPGAKFRGQEVNITVLIPYEKPFRMSESFARYIRNEFGSREIDQMDNSLWKFTKQDGLVRADGTRDLDRNDDDDFDMDDAVSQALREEFGHDFDQKGDYNRQFDVPNFDKLDIGGAFIVRVRQGDTVRVVADGRESEINDLRVRVEGGELHVDFRKSGLFQWRDRKRIGITVTMPTVKSAQFSGATKASITGFENLEALDVDMSGACRSLIDVKVNRLKVNLSGASKATLQGRANNLSADLSGACKLDATASRVGRANVEASGASKADFGEVTDLNANTSGASKVNGNSSRNDIQ
ncbi:PspC domain-containing protein [Tellurirhabdus bombi]|uniref:PspC domain-containing protein n=1 Tax=Tellurirhabdus bombi TaxID=2907205 RepID=UPI001F3DEC02|nr:PspC domain-containing protein [Tellurirhabdus bombi]